MCVFVVATPQPLLCTEADARQGGVRQDRVHRVRQRRRRLEHRPLQGEQGATRGAASAAAAARKAARGARRRTARGRACGGGHACGGGGTCRPASRALPPRSLPFSVSLAARCPATPRGRSTANCTPARRRSRSLRRSSASPPPRDRDTRSSARDHAVSRPLPCPLPGVCAVARVRPGAIALGIRRRGGGDGGAATPRASGPIAAAPRRPTRRERIVIPPRVATKRDGGGGGGGANQRDHEVELRVRCSWRRRSPEEGTDHTVDGASLRALRRTNAKSRLRHCTGASISGLGLGSWALVCLASTARRRVRPESDPREFT